jgi:hypothetical protein
MRPFPLRTVLSILLNALLGFFTKSYRGPAEDWVNDSLGGVFYVVFWCLVAGLFCRRARSVTIVLAVLAVTCSLEFLQLWHPPFLQTLRHSFLGAALLGTTFVWSDFPYYFLGAGLAWLWLRALRRASQRQAGDR